MKFQVSLISFCFSLVFHLTGNGQCQSEAGDAQCVEKITASNTFVKSYRIEGERTNDVEFSSVLVKDTRYYLNLCEEGEVSKNVVINVYDTKRKLITSNKTDQSILPELSFNCEQGPESIRNRQGAGAHANCGIGALSFRR